MPAGARCARNFHDHHARWTVYAYTCPARNFECDLFQATLTRLLEGLSCMVWVDDVTYWELDETDLINTPDLGRGRSVRCGSQVHFFRD